jgi:hypothetical protein
MKRVNCVLILSVVVVILSACASSNSSPAEEATVRGVVEGFGQKLKMVSLLSPSAAEDMKAQYSDYVSSALLEKWMGSPETAPGRMVSSPWPNRIEITSIKSTKLNDYSVTANVVEITSAEISKGGYTDKIPVQITVKKINEKWLIVEYAQGKPQS